MCAGCAATFERHPSPLCLRCQAPVRFENGSWTHCPPVQPSAILSHAASAPLSDDAILAHAAATMPSAVAPLASMLTLDPAVRQNYARVIDFAGSPVSSAVLQFFAGAGWGTFDNVTVGQLPSACGYIAAWVARQLWPLVSSSSPMRRCGGRRRMSPSTSPSIA